MRTNGPTTRARAVCLLALPLVAAACATAPPPTPVALAAPAERGIGLVIDASSSASTLYAYRWWAGESGHLPRIESVPVGDLPGCGPVLPGLSEYSGRPAAAAASLEPLFECASAIVGEDAEAQARASLHLLGTAGLRLLPAERQEEILRAVRRELASTPFGTTSARILSGAEEGIFGWIGANYVLGRLEYDSTLPTIGALDLGGASTQITFAPVEPPREHGQTLTLAGTTYRLYTYSYLGLGQDRARAAVGSPACFNAGYPIPGGGTGTGDYAACRAAIRERFARPCAREPCSLFGAYQPPLQGDFLASSVYAYAARFFELDGRLAPYELEQAGELFCRQSWQDLVASDPGAAADPYLPTFCFAAAYAVTLLTDGFGLPLDTEQVLLPPPGQAAKISWARGALLYALAGGAD